MRIGQDHIDRSEYDTSSAQWAKALSVLEHRWSFEPFPFGGA
jgi:hypothetical protein